MELVLPVEIRENYFTNMIFTSSLSNSIKSSLLDSFIGAKDQNEISSLMNKIQALAVIEEHIKGTVKILKEDATMSEIGSSIAQEITILLTREDPEILKKINKTEISWGDINAKSDPIIKDLALTLTKNIMKEILWSHGCLKSKSETTARNLKLYSILGYMHSGSIADITEETVFLKVYRRFLEGTFFPSKVRAEKPEVPMGVVAAQEDTPKPNPETNNQSLGAAVEEEGEGNV
jgi:hypothetical protein